MTDATDPVLETFPLGDRWPTLDPFLFCAHHRDVYPPADGRFGPDAPLAGRDLGADFSGRDGWSMYHGTHVPGFPAHPHRGFETVTYARQGFIDHADSLGAAARFGRGDVQWMTAGAGVVHSEMFPLFDEAAPNPVELFQVWLNLPAADKLVEPHFAMLWEPSIPKRREVDGDGRTVDVTVVAGALGAGSPPPPSPPPRSWAADPDHDVVIAHVVLAPGASWDLPPARAADANRVLYLFAGSGLGVGERSLRSRTGAVVRPDRPIRLVAGADGAECLLLQGRPIAEPVAQYGPFVMNDRAGIVRALEDYERTGFGAWPWSGPDPVHGPTPERFARHVDGELEQAPLDAATPG